MSKGYEYVTVDVFTDRAFTGNIHQGDEMGRPSRVAATAEKRGGAVVRVSVGGSCVAVMQGTFTV